VANYVECGSATLVSIGSATLLKYCRHSSSGVTIVLIGVVFWYFNETAEQH
jgi:hypothetical protein